MKWLLLLIILFLACSETPLDFPELPTFNSMNEASKWVERNIKPSIDAGVEPGKWNYWYETLNIKRGDSEDVAILLMYIADVQFGITDMKLVVCKEDIIYYSYPVIDGIAYYKLTIYDDYVYVYNWRDVQTQISLHRF